LRQIIGIVHCKKIEVSCFFVEYSEEKSLAIRAAGSLGCLICELD